jgi:hypothetical protein
MAELLPETYVPIIDGSLSYTWTNEDKISFKRIGKEVKVL